MRIAWAVIGVLLLGAEASAKPRPGPERAELQRWFEESEQAFRDGRFVEAADLLRRIHAKDPDPILLFNLARALESAGDPAGALEAYQAYLRDAPRAKNRGGVEARIKVLEADLEAERERDAPEPPPRMAPIAASPEIAPREIEPPAAKVPEVIRAPIPEPEAARPTWPWIVAGVGVATVAAAIGFRAVAGSKNDDARVEPVSSRAFELRGEAEGWQSAAIATSIGGVLLTAAGVTLGVIGL